jgi:hypothetical protein
MEPGCSGSIFVSRGVRHLPRMLGEVIYSLGQAEFGALRFVVLKQGQTSS